MDYKLQCSLLIFIYLCVGGYTASPAPSAEEADILHDVEMAVVNSANYVKDKAVEEWNEITARAYNSCSCINYNCGCCAHLEEQEIHLNSTICVNITYLVQDYGISFTVTLNNYTIYNETVSARNPPPVCIGFPYIKEYAEACVRLYDVNATTTYLHACVRVEARMKMILIAKYELGCFNIGPPGLNSDILHDVEMGVVNSANYAEDKAVEEWNKITVRAYNSCSCINYNCGYCAHLEEQEIQLNSTICVNVPYLVHDYEISFPVTLNNYTIYNGTVSARNPSPVCIGFPYIKKYAETCVRLYDVNATTTHLHACVRVEARTKKILIAKYELGCFNIGPPGLNSGINLAKSAAIHKVKLEEMQSVEKSSLTNNAVAVVGIVIGVITTVALVASLVVLVMVRRKQGLLYKHVWFGSSETTHLIPTA